MAVKQFQTESKRILDLMINSIYTHKEIFLRELISNASDAIDKLYYKSLNEGITGLSRDDFKIALEINKDERKLTITDNGIGMTEEELDNNLGVIAKSGSLNFKQNNEKNEEIDIIGQFGVGFYSAFMVADKITVLSKAYGAEKAFMWESEGAEGYEITEADKDSHGTVITLHIKDNTEEENYDEYLEQYRIQGLVKKYSDYIRYPVTLDMERVRPMEKENPEDKTEYEHYTENVTLNSMVPIWKKRKSEVSDEDYNNFYKEKFMDWEDPLRVIYTATEGNATYNALLFIPAKAPMDYYTREYEKGLQLYASGVMIMEKCADLLPDHFSFVKGLVDSQDLSLNISREMLQHDRQLKLISSRLEKKIASELKSMLTNDREKYEQFFDAFGLQLKFGMYSDYGIHKDVLKDLVMFYSSTEKKPVTLAEYVSRMKPEQKSIYYVCGENVDRMASLPQTEAVAAKGYEILYLTAEVDEFALKTLGVYEEKDFKNISSDELDLETEEEKAEAEKKLEESKDLLEGMKEALDGRVVAVKISNRLTKHPVCLSSEGQITLEMEKVFARMPQAAAGGEVKAQRVLELNPNHPVFEVLTGLYENDKDKLKAYAELLYDQAVLIEGLPVDDPVAFSNRICDLMK
ncbi:MAG: molecular chaperone HtpG [Clostridia bacterium]|nr:molecular chaperone HtpG [Clostridia bacterium]